MEYGTEKIKGMTKRERYAHEENQGCVRIRKRYHNQ